MTNPDARELLSAARELLLEKLLPALPGSLHYDTRMIASALAMAVREMDLGAAAAHAEGQRLNALLHTQGQPETSLLEARAQLCAAIDQGGYDQPSAAREQLLTELLAVARDKLRISNPKVVA